MNKKIAFFDLDGTLWNIHSDIWIIDKERPYKPVMKIPSLDFSLIRNGMYQRDELPLDYNGQKFYISKELFNKIQKKTKSQNINRFGISFNNFYDKSILNKSKVDYLLDNIEHLRGKKDVAIGLLTARSNKVTHSDVINDLRLKLKDMGISLDKIYFVGDKFKVYYDEDSSLKKVHILLEHLIGFKIKDSKFVSLRQDWYPEVHFYDDLKGNIEYANDVQKVLNDLVKNTDDDLLSIIVERINTNNIKLINYLITNNDVNRFEMNKIEIVEPDKFPIFEKKIETYENFELNEYKNPFIKGDDRRMVDKVYNDLVELLSGNVVDYNCNSEDDGGLMFKTTTKQTITYYKKGIRIKISVDNNSITKDIKIRVNKFEDNEDEEWGNDNKIDEIVVDIPYYSHKIVKIIKNLCRKKRKSENGIKKVKVKQKKDSDMDFALDIFDDDEIDNIDNIDDISEFIDESWTGVYKSDKDIKKEINKSIKDIINPFIMKYVFDYRITHFILDFLNKNTKIELTIFGFGPIGDGNKEDALLKIIFEKKKNTWVVFYKKSKIFRKIQNRSTEIKLENIGKIRTEILNYLNKK